MCCIEGRKNTPTIYSEALKALYGTVDASKLFFDDLTSFLVKDLGFTANPFDACVVNKIIEGKQCTITWHVDDIKISHKNANVVTSIIESLSAKYGTTVPLSISRGKVHEYLGMTFDFTKKGEVSITMYDQVDDIIESAPTIYKTGVGSATASPTNLYTVRMPCEGNELLSDDDREEYHTLTARCLYVSKRGRPDLQTSIAFHCIRVRNPTQDDQKKLARTIRYMMATRFLALILSVDEHGIIHWWIDESFAVYDDMKSRTGLCMSLGKGTVYAASTKQKLWPA